MKKSLKVLNLPPAELWATFFTKGEYGGKLYHGCKPNSALARLKYGFTPYLHDLAYIPGFCTSQAPRILGICSQVGHDSGFTFDCANAPVTIGIGTQVFDDLIMDIMGDCMQARCSPTGCPAGHALGAALKACIPAEIDGITMPSWKSDQPECCESELIITQNGCTKLTSLISTVHTKAGVLSYEKAYALAVSAHVVGPFSQWEEFSPKSFRHKLAA